MERVGTRLPLLKIDKGSSVLAWVVCTLIYFLHLAILGGYFATASFEITTAMIAFSIHFYFRSSHHLHSIYQNFLHTTFFNNYVNFFCCYVILKGFLKSSCNSTVSLKKGDILTICKQDKLQSSLNFSYLSLF